MHDGPVKSEGRPRLTVHDWLRSFKEALSDVTVMEASPRLRVGAAYDVAVIAGLVAAELDGCPVEAFHPPCALAYLQERSSIRSGLSAHVRLLGRFDRDDYDRIWTLRDARRSLTSAVRIQSALRWRLTGGPKVMGPDSLETQAAS